MLSHQTVSNESGSLQLVQGAPDSAMAIGAHPDDIELNAGGTLAKWIEHGCTVSVVVCTDGGAGSRRHDQTSRSIAKLRRQEQQAAAGVLGAHEVVMLELPDGGLEDTVSFRGTIVKLIRQHRPEVILTHDPHVRDRLIHRDHRITGTVALDAVYPYARDPLHFQQQVQQGLAVHRVDQCFLWDADQPNAVVDVSGSIQQKARALQQHESQLAGILGDADPIDWLSHVGSRIATGFSFGQAEAFRILQAPP